MDSLKSLPAGPQAAAGALDLAPGGALARLRGLASPSNTVVAIFTLVTAVMVAGSPENTRLFFPCLSLLAAVYLFRRNTGDYVSFTWWLYFLAPLVRRLVDYKTEYVDPSSILLAPLLASLVCCCSAFWNIRIRDRRIVVFVLPLLTVLYSLAVALAHANSDTPSIMREAVSWMAPICFGLYLYQHWRDFEKIRDAIQRTFAWGMILMGAYAIFQVIAAPDWDKFWIENAEYSSVGNPQPFAFRAFSTMNSQQPLALICLLGVFLIARRKGLFFTLASVGGYVGLVLSMSREAWVGWAVAMLALAYTDRSRKFLTVVVVTSISIGVIGSAVYLSPLGERFTNRLRTFTQGEGDEGAGARLQGYQTFIAGSLHDPFGEGFGTVENYDRTRPDESRIGAHDSMLVELLMTSGWFGCLTYGFSILAAAYWLIRSSGLGTDTLTAVPGALLAGLIAHAAVDSMTGGALGLALWTCLGLGLASAQFWTQAFVTSLTAIPSKRQRDQRLPQT